ncbi:pilus assembly protein [Bdellovibrio sp. 22V]|uniref:pilus assembly protein n=1 Tax=Bdellovibrio sp. 22V TaxID=3044166 RepID=UPI0025436DF8|nr:pilus assembly protein [Bdellovibrio sp. 22V]WII73144.1 pilus assembly protein [Bdellovibrio sp. 22V]
MKNFLLLFFLTIPAFAQPKKLLLALGDSRRITVSGNSSVWIQDRDILKAEGAGSSLVIRGLREGTTLIKTGSDTFYVQVVHPTKTNAFAAFEAHVKNIVGLQATLAEGDLLISGQLYRFQDWLKLRSLALDHTVTYQMRAMLAPAVKAAAERYFENLFERTKLPPQTVLFEPHAEVRVNANEVLVKRYQKILAPFGIHVLRDETSLDIAPTIKVQITVAEIRKDFSLKYGLRWPSSYSAQVLQNGEVEGSNLPFDLTALEGNGTAKILASPNILCRSGKEAEFLAGGEFPIKIMNYKIQDIVWKRYGILLRVKPKADSAGRISLSIDTEVSTLDKSTAVDDIPGVLTNRVSSHFDLSKPKTIALSGLLKNEDSDKSEGLPFLSRLPILGPLFSSKDFRENRTELVIFVRPTILKDGEESSENPTHLKDGLQ